MTKVNFYDSIDDSMLKFAVIIAKHNGKWVFCKHRERSTWEVPGGHREQGEDILETAKRELYEETGAINFEINPICIYSVTVPDNFKGKETFGKLFFAEIHTFEKDLHSEIEKIAIMNELPLNWTYPEIQPRLMEEARQRGFLPKKDEIKWLFFDVGSTLVDESSVYEDRMKKIAELSGITPQQIYEHAISLYRRNKKGDLEIAKQLRICSTRMNHRTDKFGGSLENRVRFARMLTRAIRKAVPGMIIDYKLSIVTPQRGKGGIDEADAVQFAQWLVEDGVDMFHVAQANHTGNMADTIPSHEEQKYRRHHHRPQRR